MEKLTFVHVTDMICSILLSFLLYVLIVMLWGVCECGEVPGEKAAEPLTTVWDCVSKSVTWPNVCDGGPRLFNWLFITVPVVTKTVFLSQKPYVSPALTKVFFFFFFFWKPNLMSCGWQKHTTATFMLLSGLTVTFRLQWGKLFVKKTKKKTWAD